MLNLCCLSDSLLARRNAIPPYIGIIHRSNSDHFLLCTRQRQPGQLRIDLRNR